MLKIGSVHSYFGSFPIMKAESNFFRTDGCPCYQTTDEEGVVKEKKTHVSTSADSLRCGIIESPPATQQRPANTAEGVDSDLTRCSQLVWAHTAIHHSAEVCPPFGRYLTFS